MYLSTPVNLYERKKQFFMNEAAIELTGQTLAPHIILYIVTDPHEILLFSVCIKSTIVVFKVAKQLSEENGDGHFC